jgi:hypothetical protein
LKNEGGLNIETLSRIIQSGGCALKLKERSKLPCLFLIGGDHSKLQSIAPLYIWWQFQLSSIQIFHSNFDESWWEFPYARGNIQSTFMNSHQLSCNSCSRLIGAWELRKLSCKLSLLNSHQLSCNSCSRLTRAWELRKLSCKLSLLNSYSRLTKSFKASCMPAKVRDKLSLQFVIGKISGWWGQTNSNCLTLNQFTQTFLTNPSKLRIYLCKIPTVITAFSTEDFTAKVLRVKAACISCHGRIRIWITTQISFVECLADSWC